MKPHCQSCFPRLFATQASALPFVEKVEQAFSKFTEEEIEALHRVNCLGSTSRADLLIVQKLIADVEAAVRS